MRPPVPTVADANPSGTWQVSVYSRFGNPRNVTVFRGAPTGVERLSTADPFGPKSCTLTFPAITMLDTPGRGDLDWLEEEANVDITWYPAQHDGESEGDYNVRLKSAYTWEGFMASFEYGESAAAGQLSVSCVGAMYQADNYLAKPEYLYCPMPYEVAIARCFADKPDLRLAEMPEPATMFPDWWSTTFVFNRKLYPKNQPWLVPSGVKAGDKWSAMLTRETGHFEPMLTSYIQGLLSNMFTPRGQFTLDLAPNRRPVLAHRTFLSAPDEDTMTVDLLWPGVKMTPLRDFTQRVGVIYAQGKAANGDTWSGMEVASDGSFTYYDPLAFRRQVHPPDAASNHWLDTSVMRKEVNLTFPDGLDVDEARAAAKVHMQKFADPGITGSLVLDTDPVRGGATVERQTIRAGMTILVKHLFGDPDGILFHITSTSVGTDGQQTLVVDSLFRDWLTVDQVRKRGRDSLVPYRMLSTTGTYDPRIPDLLFPWNYSKGAGIVPMKAAALFNAYGPAAAGARGVANPKAEPFPWTNFTTAFPPHKYPQFYARVPRANWSRADYNWANANATSRRSAPANLRKFRAYPVLLAASGTIKMAQFAAYDLNGNVKRVPFHVSIYYENSVSPSAMPMLPPDAYALVTKNAHVTCAKGHTTITVQLGKKHGFRVGQLVKIGNCKFSYAVADNWTVHEIGPTWLRVVHSGAGAPKAASKVRAWVWKPYYRESPHNYLAGQHYPFFPGAWERILPDGRTPTNLARVTAGATMIAGWGNHFEKAGFWPGSSLNAADSEATGLLVDEGTFTFDFRNLGAGVSVYDTPAKNQQTPTRVQAHVMIYCDADPAEPTFFLGRLWRQEYQAT